MKTLVKMQLLSFFIFLLLSPAYAAKKTAAIKALRKSCKTRTLNVMDSAGPSTVVANFASTIDPNKDPLSPLVHKNQYQNSETGLLEEESMAPSKTKRVYKQRKNLHPSADFKDEYKHGPVVATDSSYYDDDVSSTSNSPLSSDDFKSEFKDGPVVETDNSTSSDDSSSASSSSYFEGSNIGPAFDGNPSGSDWTGDHGF